MPPHHIPATKVTVIDSLHAAYCKHILSFATESIIAQHLLISFITLPFCVVGYTQLLLIVGYTFVLKGQIGLHIGYIENTISSNII